MSSAENARGTGPVQPAEEDDFVAGTTDEELIPGAGVDPGHTGDADMATARSVTPPQEGRTADAGRAASPSTAASPGADAGDAAPGAHLLGAGERETILSRWREIQAEFVDEPRAAIQEADALVSDLIERLAKVFASELDQLESRWASGENVSTEDLRQGLQLYRSFCERLLAA